MILTGSVATALQSSASESARFTRQPFPREGRFHGQGHLPARAVASLRSVTPCPRSRLSNRTCGSPAATSEPFGRLPGKIEYLIANQKLRARTGSPAEEEATEPEACRRSWGLGSARGAGTPTTGFVERIGRTLLEQYVRAGGWITWYDRMDQIQADFDRFLTKYNVQRTHQGHRFRRKTPAQALREALGVWEVPAVY